MKEEMEGPGGYRPLPPRTEEQDAQAARYEKQTENREAADKLISEAIEAKRWGSLLNNQLVGSASEEKVIQITRVMQESHLTPGGDYRNFVDQFRGLLDMVGETGKQTRLVKAAFEHLSASETEGRESKIEYFKQGLGLWRAVWEEAAA